MLRDCCCGCVDVGAVSIIVNVCRFRRALRDCRVGVEAERGIVIVLDMSCAVLC